MPQIVMLNGAFGVGKTTLAEALLERRPDWMPFDPEEVGFMLWKVLGTRSDFQNLPAWAPLVVETARVLIAAEGRTLVVPMTLVDAGNFETIRQGFESIAPTHHFALIAPKSTIERRLTERGCDRWAFDQIDRCLAALGRPEFAVHLDAERPVEELASEVLAIVEPNPRIRSSPDALGGDDCVGDTRIPLWLLVSSRLGGLSDEALLQSYPALSPDDLEAGWRHFQADPRRIVAQRERHYPTARLAVDATIPPALTTAIRAYGLDLLELGEVGTSEEVLRRSSELGRVLVTEYGATFKRLHRAQEGHADVLLVSTDAPLEEVAHSVAKAVFAGEVSFGFVVKIDRPAG